MHSVVLIIYISLLKTVTTQQLMKLQMYFINCCVVMVFNKEITNLYKLVMWPSSQGNGERW
jgi:hypothetical protein